MANHNLMKDPYFAQIMLRVETCIHEADHEAREEEGLMPKDSSVKSALRKAELGLAGKKPAKPPKDALENWIAGLAELLVETAAELEESEGVSKGDFLRILGAAKDSLDTRREMANSPRGYLDFLEGFIKQARNA